jgi:hypothetical protein
MNPNSKKSLKNVENHNIELKVLHQAIIAKNKVWGLRCTARGEEGDKFDF